MTSTVRNHFAGTIKEIIRGDAVAEVDVETPAGIVSAVVTLRTVDENKLKVGDKIVASVKAMDVFLERP